MEKQFFKGPAGLIFSAVLLLLCCLLAVYIGSASMCASEFFGGLLMKSGYEKQSLIIYIVRLPRVLGAVLAGAGLSVSGALLQSITGNELAGPNIIGVNSGAGFAVILLLWLIPELSSAAPFAAFFGAFLATLFIVYFANEIENSRGTVILAGIAVTVLLNAGISFISLLDSDILTDYNRFSVGGLSGVTADKLPIPALFISAGIIIPLILNRRIDALCLGDSIAVSLGIRIKPLRTVCLITASASAAAVVSFAGLLGFVGLVVPHISRCLCGGCIRRLLPLSALLGAILTVLADLLGRVLFAPTEIPVGIIMAFIGAPFFCHLLIRRKNNADLQ